ncbi:MAG TPA: glutaredoxin 3 [Miltoncostaeaceae bacterium]|jgi:glutaredoxin 3|nr:glutaredoxin 3 [Miltoncostaeaceae bacterium]
MPNIVMYTSQVCPYCTRAKALLTRKGVAFEERMIGLDPDGRQRLVELTGRRTVPQVVVDDEVLGGWDEISALDREGRLDPILGLA